MTKNNNREGAYFNLQVKSSFLNENGSYFFVFCIFDNTYQKLSVVSKERVESNISKADTMY